MSPIAKKLGDETVYQAQKVYWPNLIIFVGVA